MQSDSSLNRPRIISILIVVAAALLAAILILGSTPEFRNLSYRSILFPGAVIIGLGIAGLAMYNYYALHHRLKTVYSSNRRLLNETLKWQRPASLEPFELYQEDFGQFEKLLLCRSGVLYVNEKGKFTPVASFGLKSSDIHPFMCEGEAGLKGSRATILHKISENFRIAIGWQGRWVLGIDSPGRVGGVAVFSAISPGTLDGFREEMVRILMCRISLELDYTMSRLSYRSVRKKYAALFNDNVNLKKELRRKVYEIHSLFKESSNLYTILNEGKLLNSFILMIMGQLGLKKAAIFRSDPDSGCYRAKYYRGITDGDIGSISLMPKGALIISLTAMDSPKMMVEIQESIGSDDELVALRRSGFQACCRLVAGGISYGFLMTGDKLNDNKYLQTDLKLMSILVNMMSSALENITNYRIIEELSFTDSMTGLYNYRYFYKRLNEEIFRSRRYYRNLALVIFDIDDFKIFNDSYGHQAGDGVLRQIGAYLQELVRATDVVCRYGGEEFCIIMQETEFGEVRASIERLRKKIESYEFESEYTERAQKVTVSVGAAIYPIDAEIADKLIYCADMAMLKAKSDGKNLTRLYSDLNLPAESWNKNFRTRKE